MTRRVTITDIAKKLDISLHSVNKALCGKKGISDELRAKILKTAKEMNYRVNRVAQSMARKPLIIGTINHATFWSVVSEQYLAGIRAAIEEMQDYNVAGRYYTYNTNQERKDVIKQAIDEGVGVISYIGIVPEPDEIALLVDQDIPFSLLGTDGVEKDRLTCVRADSLTAGRLAAELLSLGLPPKSHVVAFTGYKDFRDHADKIAGFTEEILARGHKLIGVYEHLDQPDIASRVAKEAFRICPDIAGIYSSTGNSMAICQEVIRRKIHPMIVATDLYPEIKKLIRQGVITAAIYQNAPGQGAKMVELLYTAICENQTIPSQYFVPPSLVLKSNLDKF
jgi:LacI family transcriptional regulator